MPWLIAYDIEDDRTRNKAASLLLEAGCIRLQKSVFAGDVQAVEMKKLKAWLKKNVTKAKNPDDKVLLLDIGKAQLRKMQWVGSEPPDWDLLTDPPHALFI